MIHSGQPGSVLDSIVDSMVLPDREIPGFISARLMAAWSLDDGFVVQVALHHVNERRRLNWHFLLEQHGVVLVESFILESPISATYSEVALRGLEELVEVDQFPARDHYVKEGRLMLGQKTVKRPKKGDTVITRFGDAKVLEVHGSTGTGLSVSTERHGVERIERADGGWWTVRQPVAWGAWNQGFFPSVRKAMQGASEWLNHPDNNPDGRLFIIRHDARPGWRLVNCGSRAPMIHEMEGGFYGPLTRENIAAKCEEHRA